MKKSGVTKKDFLFLTISMFVVILIWVSSNLYHAYVTSTISDILQQQIIPIDPKFDTATINQLKNRQQIIPLTETLSQPKASPSAIPTPTPTIVAEEEFEEIIPSESPTPTEEILPTEEPTQSL